MGAAETTLKSVDIIQEKVVHLIVTLTARHGVYYLQDALQQLTTVSTAASPNLTTSATGKDEGSSFQEQSFQDKVLLIHNAIWILHFHPCHQILPFV